MLYPLFDEELVMVFFNCTNVVQFFLIDAFECYSQWRNCGINICNFVRFYNVSGCLWFTTSAKHTINLQKLYRKCQTIYQSTDIHLKASVQSINHRHRFQSVSNFLPRILCTEMHTMHFPCWQRRRIILSLFRTLNCTSSCEVAHPDCRRELQRYYAGGFGIHDLVDNRVNFLALIIFKAYKMIRNGLLNVNRHQEGGLLIFLLSCSQLRKEVRSEKLIGTKMRTIRTQELRIKKRKCEHSSKEGVIECWDNEIGEWY